MGSGLYPRDYNKNILRTHTPQHMLHLHVILEMSCLLGLFDSFDRSVDSYKLFSFPQASLEIKITFPNLKQKKKTEEGSVLDFF